jgi:hypothetical protein
MVRRQGLLVRKIFPLGFSFGALFDLFLGGDLASDSVDDLRILFGPRADCPFSVRMRGL